MPDDIADLLRTLYETNTAYHHIKERVVWLAGTLYLTFSTLLIAWYLQHQSKIPDCVERGHKIGVLVVIFVLTVFFIIRQNREKVHSSVLSDQHAALMRKLPSHRTHSGLKIANTYNDKA